jgi:hypothetical protein
MNECLSIYVMSLIVSQNYVKRIEVCCTYSGYPSEPEIWHTGNWQLGGKFKYKVSDKCAEILIVNAYVQSLGQNYIYIHVYIFTKNIVSIHTKNLSPVWGLLHSLTLEKTSLFEKLTFELPVHASKFGLWLHPSFAIPPILYFYIWVHLRICTQTNTGCTVVYSTVIC